MNTYACVTTLTTYVEIPPKNMTGKSGTKAEVDLSDAKFVYKQTSTSTVNNRPTSKEVHNNPLLEITRSQDAAKFEFHEEFAETRWAQNDLAWKSNTTSKNREGKKGLTLFGSAAREPGTWAYRPHGTANRSSTFVSFFPPPPVLASRLLSDPWNPTVGPKRSGGGTPSSGYVKHSRSPEHVLDVSLLGSRMSSKLRVKFMFGRGSNVTVDPLLKT
jgi:hypothetical protein